MSITKLLFVTKWGPFGSQFPKGESRIGDPKTIPPSNAALSCRAENQTPVGRLPRPAKGGGHDPEAGEVPHDAEDPQDAEEALELQQPVCYCCCVCC